MADKRIESRTSAKPTEASSSQRSLTGSAALDVAMAFAGGAGAGAGKVAIEQIAQHVTKRPKNEVPKIEVPSNVKEK